MRAKSLKTHVKARACFTHFMYSFIKNREDKYFCYFGCDESYDAQQDLQVHLWNDHRESVHVFGILAEKLLPQQGLIEAKAMLAQRTPDYDCNLYALTLMASEAKIAIDAVKTMEEPKESRCGEWLVRTYPVLYLQTLPTLVEKLVRNISRVE